MKCSRILFALGCLAACQSAPVEASSSAERADGTPEKSEPDRGAATVEPTPTEVPDSARPAVQRADGANEAANARPVQSTSVEARAPKVVQVAGGVRRQCLLFEDGRVRCLEPREGLAAPFALKTETHDGQTLVELSLQDVTTCGRRANHTVDCIRYGRVTQPLAALTGAPPVQLDSGMQHSCARLESGSVACWGDNQHGQLGNGSTHNSEVAVMVSRLSDAAEIALGSHHSCARKHDGSVVCWGRNNLGQLGRRGGSLKRPTLVAGVSDATSIEAGVRSRQTCVVRQTGAASCWGAWGMVSEISPSRLSRRGPIDLPPLDNVVELAVNMWRICGRQRPGTVSCWALKHSGKPGQAAYGDPVPAFGGNPGTQLGSSAFGMHVLQESGVLSLQGDMTGGELVSIDVTDPDRIVAPPARRPR